MRSKRLPPSGHPPADRPAHTKTGHPAVKLRIAYRCKCPIVQYQVCDHGVVPQPALFVQAHSARQDNILRVIHEEAVVQTVDVVPLKGSHILQRFNPAVYIVIALDILRRPGCHLLLQPGLGGGIGSAIEQSKAVQQLRNLRLRLR